VKDYAYATDRSYALQGSVESLHNAESYLELVMQLSTGTRPSKAPTDSISGASAEGDAVIREALAFAESWNLAATQGIQDAGSFDDVFGKLKNRFIGGVSTVNPTTKQLETNAPDEAKKKQLLSTFHATGKIFASALSVKADPDGEEVCKSNAWALYKDAVVHVCAAAVAKRSSPGNLYPTSYSVASALLHALYSITLRGSDVTFAVEMAKEFRTSRA
jgi:hypothetical protein